MSGKKLAKKSEVHKNKTKKSTGSVQSELIKLRRVEKELQNILKLVNHQINALKVEKLQLEAYYSEQENSNNEEDKEINLKKEEIQQKENIVGVPIEEINKQILDILSPVAFNLDEEFESDD